MAPSPIYSTNCASTQWNMEVVNPCLTSNFVQAISTSSLTAKVGATSKIGTQYEIPIDTASVSLGTGYYSCGDRIHYLIESITGARIYPVPGNPNASATDFTGDAQYPFIEFLYFYDGDPNDP